MEKDKEPRNMNITVRVTRSEYHKYKRLASAIDVPVSSWAHLLLKNHRMLNENYQLKNLAKELLDELLNERLRRRTEIKNKINNDVLTPVMKKRLQDKFSIVSEEIIELNHLRRRFKL